MTAPAHSQRPANRLAGETSPYLLQHARNPVDWHPWGPEALARARELDRPIFLSIGYAACHWCHVMERESFEDEATAAFLNAHFVPIKVDREERPDLDDVYMKATQVLSGHGGWPMSVFLTPERLPFYAGTYFPPLPRHGLPSFMQILSSLASTWERQRARVIEQAGRVAEHVRQLSLEGARLPDLGPVTEPPRLSGVDAAIEQLGRLFDPAHGGFGGPPKFPHADDIRLCVWQHASTGDAQALQMALHTLRCMVRGGIFDQLRGGFARYSVDGEWTVPHFEKMLYDNALLVPALLEAGAAASDDELLGAARATCEWVLAEMVDPAGGFWSTLDADSEGHEGRFYVWQRDEVLAVAGKAHAALLDDYWQLGQHENFEGHAWILRRAVKDSDATVAARHGLAPAALATRIAEIRGKLLAVRSRRVRPATDDKVLTAWNGLMISALARAGRVLAEPRFVEAARRAAAFCLASLRGADGRLLSTWRGGRARLPGHLADHAYLAAGLLDLLEADGDLAWADAALALTTQAREHFADRDHAGFFFTADDAEALIARPRDLTDGALPSSNGVMAEVLVRLHELCGRPDLGEEADRLFAMLEPLVAGSPSAFARLLLALLRRDGAAPTVVLGGGAGVEALDAVLAGADVPGLVVLPVPAGGVDASAARRWPLLAGKVCADGRATAWVCRRGTCQAPVSDGAALRAALAEA